MMFSPWRITGLCSGDGVGEEYTAFSVEENTIWIRGRLEKLTIIGGQVFWVDGQPRGEDLIYCNRPLGFMEVALLAQWILSQRSFRPSSSPTS